jgi:hypothetical protein
MTDLIPQYSLSGLIQKLNNSIDFSFLHIESFSFSQVDWSGGGPMNAWQWLGQRARLLKGSKNTDKI